ncbi:YeeE/YedE thiosulfate transporter family protein [Palleronia caenipelagi]|uniref:Response regulator SirA n=1 Tax=Palleronia caenipelagi TaxID=2489174 RepID=A0A547PJ82_9RHOB|nr:YeeE/YedE thiosulfate transporter family protein [Palleronia caenipelagi]TRD14215.1 response regulator SirA [Palleronia caenipelagi]
MIWVIFIITAACAFCVGYAIRRGSVCTVVAARALVLDGKSSRFRAFLVAAAGSGTVMIPLHWALPDLTTLSAGYPVTGFVLLSGAAFGLGAWINGACALGTLAHLTGGNLKYVGTIVGMVAGAVLTTALDIPGYLQNTPRPSPLETPGLFSVSFVVLLALCLLVALYRRVPRWWRTFRNAGSMRMGPYRSMLVVGVFGGILYVFAGNWTYVTILSHRAARLVDPMHMPGSWLALSCALAVVSGGITAALRSGKFRLQHPALTSLFRPVTGGIIMGTSAMIIPGGNGTVLLYGVPSLAPHAIAAYGTMVATLIACFGVSKITVPTSGRSC